ADAGGNLLDRRHQRKGQQHGPADAAAKLRAGLTVGADTGGIVIGGAGDQAGAERFDEGAEAEGLVWFGRTLVAAMLVMGVPAFRVMRHASDPAAMTTRRLVIRFPNRNQLSMTSRYGDYAISVLTPGSSNRSRLPKPRASNVTRRSFALCLKWAQPSV